MWSLINSRSTCVQRFLFCCILSLNESRVREFRRSRLVARPRSQALSMRAQVSPYRTHADLRREIYAAAGRERTVTAEFLGVIAEFDALRLYVPEGYASMHAFCVGALRMCEDSAYKRIQAARAVWKFPQLCPALADGRLHLSAVFTLAPHLTAENVEELVGACTHKTRREIQDLIARRFLGPAAEFRFEPSPTPEVALSGHADPPADAQLVPVPVEADPLKSTQAVVPQSVGPPQRVSVHCLVDQQKLEYARALLSHAIPSGDLDKVFDRALDAVIRETEKRKFAATPRPRARAPHRPSADARHVPAPVKREVWKRDGGQCTFLGRDGHRCGERRFLEFDHVQPVALGGEATVDDLRLRCRVHNQYEAERVFGTEFMARKREGARQARVEAREAREAREAARTKEDDRVRAVASGLRNLGCRADEARQAAEVAIASLSPDATLEECLRAALRSLAAPRGTRREQAIAVPEAVPKVIEQEEAALAAI
jgi:hypothetical protein